MPPSDLPEDAEPWNERRHRLANDAVVRQHLDGIGSAQRELKRDLDRMRDAFAKDMEAVRAEVGRVRTELSADARSGDQRGFAIQRLDERLGELNRSMNERFAEALQRLTKVEGAFVTREMLKEEISPIWKWTSVAGVAIIGAVVTYAVSLFQKGAQ